MSYRDKKDFINPTADEVIDKRSTFAWMLPIYLLLPATKLFDTDASQQLQFLYLLLWVTVTITAMWVLLGLPLRWMSARDRRKMADEWNSAATGDACKWSLAAVATLGAGLMVTESWLALDARKVIYAMVSAGISVGIVRLAWLGRGGRGDDE
jgi:hypothetical protein